MGLVIEQQVVHRPELPLACRGFSRERSHQGVRMDFLQGEVPVSDPNPADEPLEQQLHRRRGLPAVRTFEITVLDDRDRRVLGAERVIRVVDGNRELEMSVMIHGRESSRQILRRV